MIEQNQYNISKQKIEKQLYTLSIHFFAHNIISVYQN